MDNAQYEHYKKIMQKASYLRGRITDAKISVAHWTTILDKVKVEGKKEWAQKKLDAAIKNLESVRKEFADLELTPKEQPIERPLVRSRINVCPACSLYDNGGKSRIAIEHTCGLQEFDEPKNQKYRNKERNTDRLKPKY